MLPFLILINVVLSIFLLIKVIEQKGEYILIVFAAVLPFYTTFLALVYKFSKSYYLVKVLQVQKELFVFLFSIFFLGNIIYSGKLRYQLNKLDFIIIGFLLINFFYFFIPVGGENVVKILSLRANVFFVILYFIGRNIHFTDKQILYFFRVIIVTGALAGFVTIIERLTNTSFQELTGYSLYNYVFFDTEPRGNFGLTWTYETGTGIRRFGAFFANPLELASSILMMFVAAIVLLIYKRESNRPLNGLYVASAILIFIGLLNTVSRTSILAFWIQMLFLSIIMRSWRTFYAIFSFAICMFLVLILTGKESLLEFLSNTFLFTNSSSIGHLISWLDGIDALIANPLGYGLGSSGKAVLKTGGEMIGGENQYIIYAVQLGVVGLVLYLAILIMSIKNSIKAYRLNQDRQDINKWLLLFIGVTKFGLLFPLFTSNLETYNFVSYTTWILVGYSNRKLINYENWS